MTVPPVLDVAVTAGTGLHRWYRTTPGFSLIAHAGPNSTRSFHEMPSAAANAICAANPDHNLIIATWGGETP